MPSETDLRLSRYLDGTQELRERMCIDILGIVDGYTHQLPRRPRGGPDGTRDIETRYYGLETWVGVGFLNNANDSDEDKKQIKKKFKEDLEGALEQNPELRGFAFFTNVDLTPGESEELKKVARQRGMSHIDIFNRERMRFHLDSPPGYGLRLKYLSISLTDGEQKSFFYLFGDQVQRRLSRLESSMNQLTFLARTNAAVRELGIQVELNKKVEPEALEGLAVLVAMDRIVGGHLGRCVLFARVHKSSVMGFLPETLRTHFIVGTEAEKLVGNDQSFSLGRLPRKIISFVAPIEMENPPRISFLEGRKIEYYVSRNHIGLISSIRVTANDLEVHRASPVLGIEDDFATDLIIELARISDRSVLNYNWISVGLSIQEGQVDWSWMGVPQDDRIQSHSEFANWPSETVTGRLISISFTESKARIFFLPDGKEVDCHCARNTVFMPFRNENFLVHVTGKVGRDSEGKLVAIADVEIIEEIDLSPVLLEEVKLSDGRRLRLREPISLMPKLSESQQLLSLEHEPLQIDVFAPTRELLWDEVLEQVRMLWAEYGEAADEELSIPALRFRETLRAAMEVIPHGTR